MPSLQDLIERACADGAYEIVIESGHALVVATTRGRQNSGLPVSEDDIHQMLDRYLSPDQHVELAMGQRIEFDFPLRGTKGSWRVGVESNAQGTVVRATAPARPRSTGEFDAHTMKRARIDQRLPEHPGAVRGQRQAPAEPAAAISSGSFDDLDIDLQFDVEDSSLPLDLGDNFAGELPLDSSVAGFEEGQELAGLMNLSDLSNAYTDDAEQDFSPPLATDDTPVQGLKIGGKLDDPDDSAFDDMVLEDSRHDSDEDESSFADVRADGVSHVSKATRTTLRQLEAIWQDEDEAPGDASARNKPVKESSSSVENASAQRIGVPSYIPEEPSFDESFYSSPANDIGEEPTDHALEQQEGAQPSSMELEPGSLVIALIPEHAEQLAAGLAPTPSAIVEPERLLDPSTCEQLERLGRGACLLLDHEDPSASLGWVLRRLEQNYRVVLVIRASSLEGALRMLLGFHPREPAMSWLSAHPCYLVRYDRQVLSLQDLSWPPLALAS